MSLLDEFVKVCEGGLVLVAIGTTNADVPIGSDGLIKQ